MINQAIRFALGALLGFGVAVGCGAGPEDETDFGTASEALANDPGHAPTHYIDSFGILKFHAEPQPSVSDPSEYGLAVPCYSTDSASSNHVGPWTKWGANEYCVMPAINSLRDVYYVWSGVDAQIHHPVLGNLGSLKSTAAGACLTMKDEIGSGLNVHCLEGTSIPSGKYGVTLSLASGSGFGSTNYTAFTQAYSIPGGHMRYALGATSKFDLGPGGPNYCDTHTTAAQCGALVANDFEHEMLHAIGFAHQLSNADTMYAAIHLPNALTHIPMTFTEVNQISSYTTF